MHFIKGNFKFVLILFLLFFGSGIMVVIDNFNFDENKTGIIYQENNNIVLSEVNKTYNYNINYDLEESYLHYLPVKKTGFLDSFNKSKNLAIPDLTNKDYLGNGVYRLIINNGATLTYNVYSGVYRLFGNIQSEFYYSFGYDRPFPNDNYIQVWKVNQVGDFNGAIVFFAGGSSSQIILDTLENYDSIYSNNGTLTNQIFTYQTLGLIDVSFKLQLEQGTTATPYEVPYIPSMKINFQGTNQVEYINPYEEQIIKINDINNVNNIEFDLLNTKNNVVFKWNIKTNENLPFLRYYNEENKLIYDFTDIDEINSIGNTIIANTSGFMKIIEGVINMVDVFYSGFQKIFSIDNVETIREAIKIKIPVPMFPWIK